MSLLFVTTLAACAQQGAEYTPQNPYDPLEAQNRGVHAFNKALDKGVVRPVSKGYVAAVPDPIQTIVSNFSENASTPSSVLNNALRGDMVYAFEDLGRFVVNTTIGLGGIIDVATDMNMPASTDTDFGQVLYAWGVGEGAYLELPLLGPSTVRGATGKVVEIFTDPLGYVIPKPERYVVTGTSVASRFGDRGRYADTIDSILYDSADSYAQARLLYLQNRRYKLGKGPGDDYIDPYVGSDNTVTNSESTAPVTEAASAAYTDPYDE